MARLPLNSLYLSETRVNDAGMAAVGALTQIRSLRSLSTLYLNGCTRVSDASAPALARLTNLFSLYVRNSGLITGGAQAVRNQLPRCRVYEN